VGMPEQTSITHERIMDPAAGIRFIHDPIRNEYGIFSLLPGLGR
jgi:hypothetical protein